MARGKKAEKGLTPEEKLAEALVPVEERPYAIPGNWCWTNIGGICSFIGGGTPSKANPAYWNGDIPWASIKDVKGDVLTHTIDTITEEGVSNSATNICEIGDLILATRIEPGKVILAGIATAINQDLKIIKSPMNIKYLQYAFSNLQGEFLSKSSGSTVLGITIPNVQNTPIPLPPLAEQQRIVDRIESLFAKLDEAKEKAQEALESFETRKAAMLHKAFSGELTEVWRNTHKVNKGTWNNREWGTFISSIEAGKNWNAEGRPPQKDEFGVVKVSAVTWGTFNELESKTCTLAEQWNENVQINEGDFLFSRANTLQLVGNCVIVDNVSLRLMLSDKILRFKFDNSVIPKYVLYFTRSKFYREQIEALASGNQDGMRNVSQKNMKQVVFPIPTTKEQTQITNYLDSFFEKEAQAKAQIEATLDAIDLLKKSILAKAFRGELGTNDPADESALELLKKVL